MILKKLLFLTLYVFILNQSIQLKATTMPGGFAIIPQAYTPEGHEAMSPEKLLEKKVIRLTRAHQGLQTDIDKRIPDCVAVITDYTQTGDTAFALVPKNILEQNPDITQAAENYHTSLNDIKNNIKNNISTDQLSSAIHTLWLALENSINTNSTTIN